MVIERDEDDALDWGGCDLPELCERCALDRQFIVQCVEQGVAEATGEEPQQWIFSATSIVRIRKAWRLHRDLDIEISSLALVLELIEEKATLERELEIVRQRLAQWERQ